jgi:uncharacterized membrane protein
MPYDVHNQGMGGGWWALMVIVMIVFLALCVFALVALSRHHNHGSSGSLVGGTSNGPVDILNERLARGEVTEEEYTSRLNLLRGQK